MRPREIVVRDVLRQDRPQVSLVEDDQVVEALATECPNDALGDRVDEARLMTAPVMELRTRRVNRRNNQDLLTSLGDINTHNRPYHSSSSGGPHDRRIPDAVDAAVRT